ncbi:hypothetical protein QUA56_04770 [Microcoleus sp. N3A4]|uniref:hypothetical protein n=1 Tax=Microcoleus sp. N3A4 TaxID=3055379 RepID=UPI002FD7574A
MPFPYPKIIDDRPPSDIIIARLIVGKRHCRVLISLVVMRKPRNRVFARIIGDSQRHGKKPGFYGW